MAGPPRRGGPRNPVTAVGRVPDATATRPHRGAPRVRVSISGHRRPGHDEDRRQIAERARNREVERERDAR
ncbi:hypothetical protein BJF79_08935 [Actinomadura sp. CNU-125]|uniref:hypothetical protein n=1 Tax=Actinomadura sp. CNU-125 TaxID=1904961 RepID=UPI0009669A47|nr:hypothetical protein [Actinomadura sp. CNU-125]OLT31112.1 hypothetical protein BJF79_08935 [Actinomadura sp. CNU-125]